MRNEVITISCFGCLILLAGIMGHDLRSKLDDADDRVAALQQRNEELTGKIEDLEYEVANNNLILEEYHSETDAYASETDAKIDELSNIVEELKIEKEANEPVLLQQKEEIKAEETPVSNKTAEEPEPEVEVEAAYEEPEVVEDVGEPIGISYVGTYELTAYIATGNPTADGSMPSTGYTAACNDPALWHKWIHIEGYGDYYVHDTGGMSSNVIDIFVGSYDEAIQFGRRSAEVYIIE